MSTCERKSTPSSITVSALEKSDPRDAGVWSAKVLSSKSSSEQAHVAVVDAVLASAKEKGPIRCTFSEGGEPGGLRFQRADGAKVYVFGTRGVAQSGDCYDVDAADQEKLRGLAKTLGVAAP